MICFIDPRVRKIRNETSSCHGIFSRTLRFYYVASSPSLLYKTVFQFSSGFWFLVLYICRHTASNRSVGWLRVEFFLKTDSGYSSAEVTLFTLANSEHSLRFITHWSAPPVSALARSGGPRKMSQSPVVCSISFIFKSDWVFWFFFLFGGKCFRVFFGRHDPNLVSRRVIHKKILLLTHEKKN